MNIFLVSAVIVYYLCHKPFNICFKEFSSVGSLPVKLVEVKILHHLSRLFRVLIKKICLGAIHILRNQNFANSQPSQ